MAILGAPKLVVICLLKFLLVCFTDLQKFRWKELIYAN